MNKEFKEALRFVVLIATPLCFVTALIFSLGSDNFITNFLSRFFINYSVTFPQAVIYVSIVKYFGKRKKS